MSIEKGEYSRLAQHWKVMKIKLEGRFHVKKARHRLLISLETSHIKRLKTIVHILMPPILQHRSYREIGLKSWLPKELSKLFTCYFNSSLSRNLFIQYVSKNLRKLYSSLMNLLWLRKGIAISAFTSEYSPSIRSPKFIVFFKIWLYLKENFWEGK